MKAVRNAAFCFLLLGCFTAFSQQINDDTFKYENPNPAFSEGSGPLVCWDEGHFNIHTSESSYKAFADLLRGDGYQILRYGERFSNLSARNCNLLIIANPLSEYSSKDWDLPHDSAFTRDDIDELVAWIIGGGNLLLVADHSPVAGNVTDLGAVLGIMIANAYALMDQESRAVFRTSTGTLMSHKITQGRSELETIDSLVSFGGLAAIFGEMWDPITVFGENDTAYIRTQHTNLSEEIGGRTEFSIAGWWQGASRTLGDGRIVFQGEAAMCSAQIQVRRNNKLGMNNPIAPQNAQFCLNTVRWLTGVLD